MPAVLELQIFKSLWWYLCVLAVVFPDLFTLEDYCLGGRRVYQRQQERGSVCKQGWPCHHRYGPKKLAEALHWPCAPFLLCILCEVWPGFFHLIKAIY